MAMTTYNAKDCTITVGGVFLTGLSETMVTGSKDEEFFDTAVGAKGDIVVNQKNNPIGTVTVTLQATSPSRSFLSGIAYEGKVVPVWVTNKSTGERFGGSQAMLKKTPDVEYGAEAGDREYEFAVFDYTVS